jgi:hypothetical protein
MKRQIIDLMQETVAAKGGVYTALFGSESSEVHKELNVNWVFDGEDWEQSVPIIMEQVVALILQCYDVTLTEVNPKPHTSESVVVTGDGTETAIRFLTDSYELKDTSVRFADLENYLNDIDVTESAGNVYFKWKFPVYIVDPDSIVRFI